MSISGNEIRDKYLKFMVKHGHAILPSSSLVPNDDPTTLFTGSGMQSLLPYLMGETHPKGKRITNSQKCFRAEDIDEVGDNRHTTFFEMLGNWSFGDYFKEEQLKWIFEFLVDKDKGGVGLDPKKLYVTVFSGEQHLNLSADDKSAGIWQKLFATKGLDAKMLQFGKEETAAKAGMQGARIFYYNSSKNWWSRAGKPEDMPVGEIGGSDSEVFYEFTDVKHDTSFGEHCHPNCDCGRFMEIGNNVFMEYVKNENGTFSNLPAKNVDFGGGLERITAAANDNNDMFKADLLWNIVEQIQELSNKKYEDNFKAFRIITDHIRGAVFMIGDDVLPNNTEQGYFVRRLLRRAVRYADMLDIKEGELKNLALSVIETYGYHYNNLTNKSKKIMEAIAEEERQFRRTLEKGMRILSRELLGAQTLKRSESYKHQIVKMIEQDGELHLDHIPPLSMLSGEWLFNFYQTFGFPFELAIEEIEKTTQKKLPSIKLKQLKTEFDHKVKEHQVKSRAGAKQKFKGGLSDKSEKVLQYHTTTHLLLAGLRKELGADVHQAGSNITGERLRFDFTYKDKVEHDVLLRVEEFVNNAIQSGGEVTVETMSKIDAENDSTIEGSFWERYPDEVKVYTMKGADGTVFSRELCGGPHVENLKDIMGVFKITKEGSSSAGVRRIKAILE